MSENARPNILIIMTDQHHADAIGGLGRWPGLYTPGLDRLVESGVSFNRCYATYPLCSPSRSSIFTSRMPSETGVFENNHPIREGIPTLGRWFAEHGGYRTAYAGKWHVPRCYTADLDGYDVISTGIGHQGTVSDPALTVAAENYLRAQATHEDPWLLVASYMQPHDICEWLRLQRDDPERRRHPVEDDHLPELPRGFEIPDHEAPFVADRRASLDPTIARWSDRSFRVYRHDYARHVEMIDAEIARLLTALDDLGQTDNTLIVFLSDHGEGVGEHRMTRKDDLYDASVRVPFVVRCPRRFPGGREEDALASTLDLFPTLCDLAGLDVPPGAKGMSLVSLLEETPHALPRVCVAAEADRNQQRMIRGDRYKFVAHRDGECMLFDMNSHPGESRNVAPDVRYTEELTRQYQRMQDWFAALDTDPRLPAEVRWGG